MSPGPPELLRLRLGIVIVALGALLPRVGPVRQAFIVNYCYLGIVQSPPSTPNAPNEAACIGHPGSIGVQASYAVALGEIARGDLEPALSMLALPDPHRDSRQDVLWAAVAHGFYQQGDVPGMIWAWRQAGVYDHPWTGHQAFYLGQQALNEGRPDVAYALFRAAGGMDLQDARLRLDLAKVLIGQYDDKTSAAEELLRVNDPETLTFQEVMQLATLWRQAGRYSEARRWFTTASSMDAVSSGPRIETAITAMYEGEYREAEQIALGILTAHPDDAGAYTVLGWAYNAQGQYGKAEDAERNAISINGEADWAHSLLAWSLAAQAEVTEAESAFRHAVDLAPGEVSYVVQLADFLVSQNWHKEALALYRQAMSMDGAARFRDHIRTQITNLTR